MRKNSPFYFCDLTISWLEKETKKLEKSFFKKGYLNAKEKKHLKCLRIKALAEKNQIEKIMVD